MQLDQLLRTVQLVVLFDLVVVDRHLLAEDCAALGHEVLGNHLRLLHDLALLHLLLRSARSEDLVELVLLFYLKLLLLLLTLRQLLLEHLRHLLPHLRRNVGTHRAAVICH